jgi:hypothetical protein
MNINLQVPIWTIEHDAAALHTSVDTAREHTSCARLPTRDRRSTKHVKDCRARSHSFQALAGNMPLLSLRA